MSAFFSCASLGNLLRVFLVIFVFLKNWKPSFKLHEISKINCALVETKDNTWWRIYFSSFKKIKGSFRLKSIEELHIHS